MALASRTSLGSIRTGKKRTSLGEYKEKAPATSSFETKSSPDHPAPARTTSHAVMLKLGQSDPLFRNCQLLKFDNEYKIYESLKAPLALLEEKDDASIQSAIAKIKQQMKEFESLIKETCRWLKMLTTVGKRSLDVCKSIKALYIPEQVGKFKKFCEALEKNSPGQTKELMLFLINIRKLKHKFLVNDVENEDLNTLNQCLIYISKAPLLEGKPAAELLRTKLIAKFGAEFSNRFKFEKDTYSFSDPTYVLVRKVKSVTVSCRKLLSGLAESVNGLLKSIEPKMKEQSEQSRLERTISIRKISEADPASRISLGFGF